MPVIQTHYGNHFFRSRLEARWAVFFNTLGIPYEYEIEGYNLNGLWYLPDFYMPKQDCWIEIKGIKPTKEEDDKAWLLSGETKKNVYIFWGQIGEYPTVNNVSDVDGAYMYNGYDGGQDSNYNWCQCSYCGAFGIEFEGRSARIGCCRENLMSDSDKEYTYDSPDILRAIEIASKFRFEHHEER